MDSSKAPSPTFGEPTPLGLLGLAIGCAALVPVAFGMVPKEPAQAAMTFQTCAWLCLVFGAGCQLLAGLMALANKNVLGGTLLTTFSFNWIMNWWALDQLAHGKIPDATVIKAVDCAFLVIFVVLAFAFALVSKVLFAFLADIVALYVLRIAGVHGAPIGMATIVLAAIALYIALAILVNDAAGRVLMPLGAPLVRLRAAEPPREVVGSPASLQMS
jgi:succinate-acetate transporter protein